MKKLILTICAALAMFGCENESFDSAETLQEEPISFGNVQTRAVSSASDISNFKVWSCVASTADGAAQSYLTEEEVRRNGNNWEYDNTRYWISNKHFYFLGLYAEQGETMQNLAFTENRYKLNDADYMAYSLNVQTPATADLDILTAFNYTDTNEDDYLRTVSMNFSHLMTKVNFKIQQNFDKDPDFDYYVTKVTLSGVKNSAIYGVFPLATYDSYYIPIWESLSGSASFSKTFTEPVKLRSTGTANPVVTLNVWGDDGLLLIPQPMEGTVKIRVDYLYDIDLSDDDKGKARYVETAVPLAANLWKSGKVITYTLKISESTEINFSTPTINPWGSPQTGGTVIIK